MLSTLTTWSFTLSQMLIPWSSGLTPILRTRHSWGCESIIDQKGSNVITFRIELGPEILIIGTWITSDDFPLDVIISISNELECLDLDVVAHQTGYL